jgi:hypothetical protein
MLNQKKTVDFNAASESYRDYESDRGEPTNGAVVVTAMDMLQQHCHAASYNRGWWHDPVTGVSLLPGDGEFHVPSAYEFADAEHVRLGYFPLVVAAKIALIHSETSEMLEAHRTGAWDDKIPFPGMTAEGADVMIRLFDLFGMLTWAASKGIIEHHDIKNGYSLGAALLTKLPFNVTRADHALEKRTQPGQKKY